MPRLIWVFAGFRVTLLVLSCRGSFHVTAHVYHSRCRQCIHLFSERNIGLSNAPCNPLSHLRPDPCLVGWWWGFSSTQGSLRTTSLNSCDHSSRIPCNCQMESNLWMDNHSTEDCNNTNFTPFEILITRSGVCFVIAHVKYKNLKWCRGANWKFRHRE